MQCPTLDDQLTLLSAKEDPVGFVRSLNRAVIDEIQRAHELLLVAIKKSVDEDRRPGRILLTGSANLKGGYPKVLSRATTHRRVAWCRQYINALVQRDVRDIANINRLDEMPRLLRGLAHSAGQPCNYSQLGGAINLDSKTAARYTGVFEQMLLLKRLDVWASNRLSRLTKTPKLQFLDPGLLAAMLEISADELHQDRMRLGALLETFVFSELQKHCSVANRDYQLLYYRDADKVEVDLVIEDALGNIVGVEVKAAATVKASDLRGLKKLAGLAGDKFKLGVVLYDGTETLPLGDRVWAVPVSSLWGC